MKASSKKTGSVEFKGDRTNVLNCHCAHAFQDSKYGSRRRVHNRCVRGWRCSVCESEKPNA